MHPGTGKRPIIRLVVRSHESPVLENFSEDGSKGTGFFEALSILEPVRVGLPGSAVIRHRSVYASTEETRGIGYLCTGFIVTIVLAAWV